ncbi:AAA family ATPase [Methylomonas sp. SURF-2]|uniref:AAA family ATPase n=1 Tax=Methylomonas subterranea TaxID=2952225 RepID=A0ABT1TE88_9GAMM|nr:ATP-binding protein [Methylomonas sp. SURF-2]MCQ8103777.1 AAA family ATPase [Methylomonas sp. SURF-2]
MLKKLTVENFTNFDKAEFSFVPGINIIIGENSSGKSHVLKLAYSIASVWNQCGKEGWKSSLKNKLYKVFRVSKLRDLQSLHDSSDQECVTRMILEFSVNHKNRESEILDISLGVDSINVKQHPTAPLIKSPLFFPAKEVLSLFPNFATLYEKYYLSFDETYYDLCKAIDNPLLKKPNQSLIDSIEEIIGGKFFLRDNNFYLETEQGEINIFMVAEGWRKLGMLSYLIANDSLKEDSILFWDEPETNLNPRLIKQLAAILVELTKYKVQVVIATHNLFLMKCFDYLIANAQTKIPTAFFSLVRTEEGINVEHGARLSELDNVVSLNEELELYDKEQEALYSSM